MAKLIRVVFSQAGGRYFLVLLLGILLEAAGYRLFAERNGWAYFTLGLFALIPIALFFNNRAVVHLFGLLCIVLLMGGVYWLDLVQETDREQALRKTQELLRAVETTDFSTFERYINDKYVWQEMTKKSLLERARRVLSPAQRRSCSISAAQVQGNNGDPTLVVTGNLTATGQFGAEDTFFTGVIEMTFTRQPDGQYQLTKTSVRYPGGQEVTLPSR
jgi:hypothetical protein